MTRLRFVPLVLAVALLGLAACQAPVGNPGDTSKITLVSTTTENGWKYEFFRNTAYPCAVSGYHTFSIATKVGSSATAEHPLWVLMHGGGVGYFRPDGTAVPNTKQKVEESAALQRTQVPKGTLQTKVAAHSAGFRFMTVSMCSHDIYAGGNIADPNNPNTTPDGKPRTVNGLFATKAAVQFTLARYPTSDYFLHGGSAGSFGSYHVAWGLQQQGIPPTGIVADSGVLNQAWQAAQKDNVPCNRTDEALTILQQRLHPTVLDAANQPHLLVADGRLSVPVADVFSIGDTGQCGTEPMACPLPNGTAVTKGSVECLHEPMRAAIAAQGASSKSLSMRLCVSPTDQPGTCSVHTPSHKSGLVNTAAPWPADYGQPLLTWVVQRMADD